MPGCLRLSAILFFVLAGCGPVGRYEFATHKVAIGSDIFRLPDATLPAFVLGSHNERHHALMPVGQESDDTVADPLEGEVDGFVADGKMPQR